VWPCERGPFKIIGGNILCFAKYLLLLHKLKTRYMDKEEFNEKQIDALDNAVVIQTLSEELDKDIDELLRRFCLPDKYKMPVLTTVSARLIFQKGLLLGYPEGLEPVRQIFLYGLDKQLDQLMQAESKKNNE
jgi:hypothetical protein